MRGPGLVRAGSRIAACFFLAILAGACGKKAPPVPPPQPGLPRVADLSAVTTEAGVKLGWSLPADGGVEGFKVYRTERISLEAARCPDCPRNYVQIGEVAVKPEQGRLQWVDRTITVKGRYYYRVIPYDDRGRPGPASNQVEVVIQGLGN